VVNTCLANKALSSNPSTIKKRKKKKKEPGLRKQKTKGNPQSDRFE
jgi:hypothetical protein